MHVSWCIETGDQLRRKFCPFWFAEPQGFSQEALCAVRHCMSLHPSRQRDYRGR
jgi:hypothetical protein